MRHGCLLFILATSLLLAGCGPRATGFEKSRSAIGPWAKAIEGRWNAGGVAYTVSTRELHDGSMCVAVELEPPPSGVVTESDFMLGETAGDCPSDPIELLLVSGAAMANDPDSAAYQVVAVKAPPGAKVEFEVDGSPTAPFASGGGVFLWFGRRDQYPTAVTVDETKCVVDLSFTVPRMDC